MFLPCILARTSDTNVSIMLKTKDTNNGGRMADRPENIDRTGEEKFERIVICNMREETIIADETIERVAEFDLAPIAKLCFEIAVKI